MPGESLDLTAQLLQRIEKLEVDGKASRRIAYWLLLGVVAAMITGALSPMNYLGFTANRVKTHSLGILNSDGKVVAELRIANSGPALALFGDDPTHPTAFLGSSVRGATVPVA